MNQKKKKNRPSKYLIIMSVVLSILCIGLLVFDVVQCRETNMAKICDEKESYLQSMVRSGDYDADSLITYIKEEYPTSASDYCFVADEGQLIFVRDDNMTKNLKETDVRAYFGIKDQRMEKLTGGAVYQVLLSGKDWYIICHNEETDAGMLMVGICVSKEYLVAGRDFDVLLQHSFLYMALFSIAFIVSIIFLSHREKENALMEQKLTAQLTENRRLIERLGERLEAQSGMDYQRENGFCNKEVVAQVMGQLTPEQKERCYKVRITLENTEPQAYVRLSVLLERMKVNKSICCLWNEAEFLVILLNTDENGASNFIKQFLMEYQKMFRSDLKDVAISIEKFYSGGYR